MNKPELKPCPFCGGEAREWTHTRSVEPVGQSWIPGEAVANVTCRKCRVNGRQATIECGPRDATDADIEMALQEAVEFWNTRAKASAPMTESKPE